MHDANEEQMIAGLARQIVARSAPQELPLFRATSAAYFQDPARVTGSDRPRDEMLGFGVTEAVTLLTPVALEVARSVVTFLAAQVRNALEGEASEAIASRVHRLVHPPDGAPPPPDALSPEQLRQVHDVAMERAQQLELPAAQAALLADAVVGGLATA